MVFLLSLALKSLLSILRVDGAMDDESVVTENIMEDDNTMMFSLFSSAPNGGLSVAYYVTVIICCIISVLGVL